MTGSNHAVTGAIIATTLAQPSIALPLALASHFVLDALPHYGDTNRHSWLNRHFNYVLGVDAAIIVLFLLTILIWQPVNWILIILCALVAISPDLVWLPHYIADLKEQSNSQTKQLGWFVRFSKWIQWGERPWGIYIEVIVLAGLLAVFWLNIS